MDCLHPFVPEPLEMSHISEHAKFGNLDFQVAAVFGDGCDAPDSQRHWSPISLINIVEDTSGSHLPVKDVTVRNW